MNITEEKNGSVLTVKPEGRLDTLSSRDLENFLNSRYGEATRVIFDFEKVIYISSAGLRVLIQALNAMKEKDGIALRNVCPQVMEVLTLSGYIHVLKIEE